MTRMPDSLLRRTRQQTQHRHHHADVPENANGVLYALGGFSGGPVVCYVKDGVLSYEYNLFRNSAHYDRPEW